MEEHHRDDLHHLTETFKIMKTQHADVCGDGLNDAIMNVSIIHRLQSSIDSHYTVTISEAVMVHWPLLCVFHGHHGDASWTDSWVKGRKLTASSFCDPDNVFAGIKFYIILCSKF